MNLKWKTLVLLCVMSTTAWAESVFVEPVKGGGIPDSDRESVEELIRIAVPQAGAYTVAGKKEEATYILSPALMKLGEAYVLSLQKKNPAGNTIYGERMKAAQMSDLDTVATRLTRAVLSGSTADSTMDVTSVTEQDQKVNRRVQATRQWILGFGPGWTSNLGSEGGGFTFVLGWEFGVSPDMTINARWMLNNGRKDDDSSYTDISLGAEYYFSRSMTSPFVGARLGWGTARVDDDKCNLLSVGCKQDRASGWAANASAGVKFFRTSNVNMAVFGNYSRIFDRTSLGDPSLASVQIAVYF